MNKEAYTKIQQVALYLGRPWKFDHLYKSNWAYEIVDGAGRGLFFRLDKKMFRISGQFSHGRARSYSRANYKSIGVSIARPAKDIAADITRRLLPDYMVAYEEALEYYQKEQEKAAMLDIRAQALAKVTQGRICPYAMRSAKTVYFDDGKAEIWSDLQVTLELKRLSVEQAIKIAGLLMQEKGGA